MHDCRTNNAIWNRTMREYEARRANRDSEARDYERAVECFRDRRGFVLNWMARIIWYNEVMPHFADDPHCLY